MVGFLYRALIALVGLTPISFAILCKGNSDDGVVPLISSVVLACFVCFLAHVLLKQIFRLIIRNCTTFTLDKSEISAVNPKRSGLQMYFMAYMLPLFLGDSTTTSFVILCLVGLIIASLSTTSIIDNPMIYTLGYKFYEIQTKTGITYLLISKNSPQSIIRGVEGIIYNNDTVIQG